MGLELELELFGRLGRNELDEPVVVASVDVELELELRIARGRPDGLLGLQYRDLGAGVEPGRRRPGHSEHIDLLDEHRRRYLSGTTGRPLAPGRSGLSRGSDPRGGRVRSAPAGSHAHVAESNAERDRRPGPGFCSTGFGVSR